MLPSVYGTLPPCSLPTTPAVPRSLWPAHPATTISKKKTNPAAVKRTALVAGAFISRTAHPLQNRSFFLEEPWFHGGFIPAARMTWRGATPRLRERGGAPARLDRRRPSLRATYAGPAPPSPRQTPTPPPRRAAPLGIT